MTENRTKIIDLKDNEKEKLSQLKKNKKKVSKIVDTGKSHEVSKNAFEDYENNLTKFWSKEYKLKYKNPFKRIYSMVNEEEMNESTSEAFVRFFDIIIGICVIILVVLFIAGYHVLYSSYSANYKRAETAEQRGDFDSAIKYYSKALDKTNNNDNKIEILNNLISISEQQEAELNVKSYLLDLVITDPENIDALLKLKSLYLADNDLDSIFELSYAIKDFKSSELLYDVIQNQPVFNYKSGTYDEPLSIIIESGENCTVYYTLDGSAASENSILYSEPFTISELGTTTIHAVSVNSDGIISNDYSVIYEIISNEVDPPNVFPQSGTYNQDTEIAIDVPSGYNAYYTLDGTEPDKSSLLFSKGMTIPYGNHIFTVKFINSNGNESQAVSRVYIFEPEYEITLNEAYYLLKKEVVNSGLYTEADGDLYNSNGDKTQLNCKTIVTLNEQLFYCIAVSDTYYGESEYAVQVDNGAVFKLIKNESGKYILTAVR